MGTDDRDGRAAEKREKALKKAGRSNLQLFTTLARRSRGREYIELAQLVPEQAPRDTVDVVAATAQADAWMEQQRELMRLQRGRLEDFERLSDETCEDGERGLSKRALAQAFSDAGLAKSSDEIDELFALIDTDGNGVISFEEYLEACAKAEAPKEAVAEEEEEEEEEEEVELRSSDFIVGLKTLEFLPDEGQKDEGENRDREAGGGGTEGLGAAEYAGRGLVTWELLRGMMQKQPSARLPPSKALALMQSMADVRRKEQAAAQKVSSGALAALRDEIKALQAQHKEINDKSDVLKTATGVSDAIVYTELQVLKKQKLALKDQIARLQRLLEASS